MKVCFLLLVVLCLCVRCHGGVAGIDLGSEFVKVAIVRPGAGVEIVLNEQSARKTATYIGFRGAERFFGQDAFNLHTRFPTSMLTYLKHLLGEPLEQLDQWKARLMFPFFNITSTTRETALVEVMPGTLYTAEELMAMFLLYMKTTAEKHAGFPVTDVAITIPAFFTGRQRQAVLDAATLANLSVLSLMHDSTAAALQYGVQNRGFENREVNVAIFDMGASSLEITVVTFVPPVNGTVGGKKSKKPNALGTMKVRSTAHDDQNGGRYIDAQLARHIASQFAKKHGVDVLKMNTLNAYKAVAKLLRSATKAKETLSANKEVMASVEGMWDDKDFNLLVTRSDLEPMVAPLAERAVRTLEEAVRKAGLTLADLDSVELMGGGSRVVAIQEALQAALKKPLGRSLNTDEATALGAAFHAARLSGSFRVRSFDIASPNPRNISFALSPDEQHPEPAVRPLFTQSSLPAKKQITVFRKKSFNLTLFERLLDPQSGEETLDPLTMYSFQGVSSIFSRMGVDAPDAHPESKSSVEVKIMMSEHGTVSLQSATAKYEQVVNTTKRVRVTAVANETSEDASSDKAEDVTNASDVSNATKAKQEPQYTIVNTTKTVGHRESIVVSTMHLKKPLPMADDDFSTASATLARLKAVDDEKFRRAEAKNDLHALVLHTKYDGFVDNEELRAFATEQQTEQIKKLLEELEEWLDESSDDATVKDFKQQQKRLTTLLDPIAKLYEDSKKPFGKYAADNDSSNATDEAKPEATTPDFMDKGDNDDDDEGDGESADGEQNLGEPGPSDSSEQEFRHGDL